MLIKIASLGFFGSVFPVVLFNIDRKKIFWSGLAGSLGWIVYNIIFKLTCNSIISSFFGAFVVTTYSEFMARIKLTPTSMFYIPGIFPLVPGVIAYRTILSISQKDINSTLSNGILVIAIGGAICLGIMLSSTIVKIILNFVNKKY